MTTQEIFEKYWDAMVTTNIRLGGFDENVVRTILHLAIRDAASGAPEVDIAAIADVRNTWRALAEGLKADVADLHQQLANALQMCDSQALRLVVLEAMVAEQPRYEEQQNRLMRWLIDNEPEASLACDADHGVAGAILDILDKQRQAIANYDTALSHAQNEAAMLRQQRANLQADLDREIAELTLRLQTANGASLDPTPTPDWGPSHPAWQGLTAEEQGTVAKLAEGAIRFRSVPKGLRLLLIGRILRHIGSGSSKITMAQYNSQRPAWIAEATSITQYVESNKWQDVVSTAMQATQ